MSLPNSTATFDPADPNLREDPYPVYRWFREHDPVHRRQDPQGGGPARHFVFRAEDVTAGLRDPRLVRAERRALWDETRTEIPEPWLPFTRMIREWVLFMDPPDHAIRRRVVDQLMNGRIHRTARRRTEVLCHELARSLGGAETPRSFDLMADFAVTVPLRLIADALGIADADLGQVRRQAVAVMSGLGGGFSRSRMDLAGTAASAMAAMFDSAVARHRASPPSDQARSLLLDTMIRLSDETGEPPPDTLSGICVLLLLASHHNTTNLIGNGVLALLRNPAQWNALVEDPRLARPAADELLRYDTPVQLISRHAAEDLELGGRIIRAGEGVTFMLGSANRDPEFCPSPDILDVSRRNQPNFAFGAGVHECPGAALAKLQIQAALSALADAMPSLKLDAAPVEWGTDINFRGPVSLRVRIP